MRKFSILLSTLLLAALLLAACGGAEETNTAAPSTNVATEAPTEEVMATETPAGTETVMPGDETTTPGIPVTGENDPARLSNELNFDVWNQNGEQVGEVNDIILDLDNARVAYVIVGTGGFLEIGEKDVLVPWDQLDVQSAATGGPAGDQNAFILNADQALFENAPDVDLDAVLPDPGGPAADWDAEIRSYWESGVVPATAAPGVTDTPEAAVTETASPEATAATPSPEATGAAGVVDLQGVVLASDVLGSPVELSPGQGTGEGTGQATATPGTTTDATTTVDPNAPTAGPGVGNFNGTVDDMIIDIDTGDIRYVVVHADFDDGERWIPIPLNFFQWDNANDTFVINANPAMLRDAPSFEDGQFPDTTADGWNSEIDAFWQ